MKNFSIQKKMKLAFICSLIFAGFIICIMYINMRLTAKESIMASAALNTLTQVDEIASGLKNIDENFHTLNVSGKAELKKIYDSVMPKVLQAKKQLLVIKNINTFQKQSLKIFDSLAKIKIDALSRTLNIIQQLQRDTIIPPAISENGKSYLQNINAKRIEIDKVERALLNTTNKDQEKHSKVLMWSLFLLSLTFFLIFVNGYLLIMQDFKKSEIINKNLRYNSTLLGNISDAIVSVDENLVIKTWNKYAEVLYGFSEKDATNKIALQIIKTSGITLQTIFELIKHNGFWRGEMQHYTKDGVLMYVEVSAAAIYDDKKNFTGAIAVIHNITNRVSLQNTLKDLSEKLQKDVNTKANDLDFFFERIADAFFILDNNWNYTYLNKASTLLHNATEEYLIGKNFWEECPELVGEPFHEALALAKQTKKPIRKEFYYSKEDKWFEDLIYPSEDGVSVYYKDITNRKKSELQLSQLHKRLSFHLTNTPLAVLEFNGDFTILHWSKRAEDMFGWSAEDIAIESIKMDAIIHKDDVSQFYDKLQTISENKNSSEAIHIRGIKKDGSVIYCDWYNSYLKEDIESKGVMLSMIKNVTDSRLLEIELANTEAKFRSLVEASLVGVYIRKNEQLIYVNPRFEKLFGYTAEELYRSDVDANNLINKDDKIIIDKHRSDYAEKKTAYLHYEFRGIHKSGKIFYAEVFGTTAILNNDEVVVGTVIDITERKEAEEKVLQSEKELIKSNERFELVAKATQDGIWDWDIVSDSLTGNDTFKSYYAHPKNEVLKFNDFLNSVNKNDRRRLADNFYTAVKNKEPLLTEEFRFTDTDGNEKILFDRAYILYDENNVAYRMLGAMQDITNIKEAEKTLTESRERYKLLFNENPLPMWIISKQNFNFIDVNESAIKYYGYSKNEFAKMSAFDIHPKDDVEFEEWNKLSEAERIGKEKNWKHQKKDGTIIKVNIISNNIVYNGENAILALANDITAKHEAEEKLHQSNEAFRELASKLETIRENERTHLAREVHDELGQQLTGLKMDISWINKRVKPEEEAVQEKIKEIIQLIDKTVITVRRIATELRPSILDDLGLIAAMEWQSEEFEKRSEIKSNFISNVSNIIVPPDVATGLFRIFQESLTNVSRHANATKVSSSIIVKKDSITLSIEDNGKGFNEAEIVGKKTLGLLGMKERVFLIKGTYNIDGNKGVGTSVTINVPLK